MLQRWGWQVPHTRLLCGFGLELAWPGKDQSLDEELWTAGCGVQGMRQEGWGVDLIPLVWVCCWARCGLRGPTC